MIDGKARLADQWLHPAQMHGRSVEGGEICNQQMAARSDGRNDASECRIQIGHIDQRKIANGHVITGGLYNHGLCRSHPVIAVGMQCLCPRNQRSGRIDTGCGNTTRGQHAAEAPFPAANIEHAGRGLFAGLESPIEATRYHSLVIDPPTLPRDFEVDAWSTAVDGSREIMAIRHRMLPVYGLQFHPESFLTPVGYDLLRAFLATNTVTA